MNHVNPFDPLDDTASTPAPPEAPKPASEQAPPPGNQPTARRYHPTYQRGLQELMEDHTRNPR